MSKQGHPVLGTVIAALALLVGGCSGSAADLRQADIPRESPPMKAGSALAESTTFADVPGAVPDPAPQAATDGVVLRVKQNFPLYDTPGGKPFATLPPTQLDNPTWVPVIAERDGWFQVLLPSRPNGSTGWLQADGAEQVEKARSPYLVDVDVDARRLTVLARGREIGSWEVGVGAPGTPTPRGRTFVMASIEETVTRFSPVILPLGTHSTTLNDYGGGPGTVALHGWPDPSVFGSASSDGCVRVPDDALRQLTQLPLGTLVLLR